MGKVKDEAPAAKSAKQPASKGSPSKGSRRRIPAFLTNLFRGDTYKPSQGWNARLWTGIGLGLIVAAGLYRFYQTFLVDQYTVTVAFTVPVVIGVVLAWILFRILHYPPFAEFLIATEAEMNKVSWTNWNELKRATAVVLVTVLVMSVFLFGVDLVWSRLLQLIGVLRFSGGGGFGSQAG